LPRISKPRSTIENIELLQRAKKEEKKENLMLKHDIVQREGIKQELIEAKRDIIDSEREKEKEEMEEEEECLVEVS
jgi:hypothetical protein